MEIKAGASEKPRHVEREAGLIITSDFCPVTPGSYTRRLASLAVDSFSCVFDLTGRVISLLELDRQTVPAPFGGG